MDIRTLAWFLLLGQIGSALFMLAVIVRQIGLFRLHIQHDIIWFRRVLFFLALVIFFGNAIPLAIDVVTVLGLITRSTNHVNTIGLYYSASNTLVAFTSSVLIWLLYRLAARTVLITESDKEVALEAAGNNDVAGAQ